MQPPEQGLHGMTLKGLLLMVEPPLTPVSCAAHCLTKVTECNVWQRDGRTKGGVRGVQGEEGVFFF